MTIGFHKRDHKSVDNVFISHDVGISEKQQQKSEKKNKRSMFTSTCAISRQHCTNNVFQGVAQNMFEMISYHL